MALTAWSSFYDHILPEVTGVAPALADFHLRQQCVEFCENSRIHTAEITPIDILANTATYTLTSPVSGAEPFEVNAAWYNGRPLDYAPIDALNQASNYWRSRTGTEALGFTQKQPDQIILYPQPDTALVGGLRVDLVLRPTSVATGLTDWIANRYMKYLAAGVKARLMSMPDKPWTRPDFAQQYLALYQAGETRATIDANRSFTRGALSAQMRPAVSGRKWM